MFSYRIADEQEIPQCHGRTDVTLQLNNDGSHEYVPIQAFEHNDAQAPPVTRV